VHRTQISPESFYVQRHQALYEAMLGLHEAPNPSISSPSPNGCAKRGQLDAVGGDDELARLIAGHPDQAHASTTSSGSTKTTSCGASSPRPRG
jgi:replicative DNA helicase